jgi:hypothetical protein
MSHAAMVAGITLAVLVLHKDQETPAAP